MSHFIRAGSQLDAAAQRRHATQYLRVPASFGAMQVGSNEQADSAESRDTSSQSAATSCAVVARSSSGGDGDFDDDAPQCILRIPMLPSDVSYACSLNPNEDRYAVTVTFIVDEEVDCTWQP